MSTRLVTGLEAIIDAATGILAAQSLAETLQGMADALSPIVPYTSLAVYEVAWAERVLIPLLATGCYVPETLSSRPTLDGSITGSAVLRAEVICLAAGDAMLRQSVMPGTPESDSEAILVAPLLVGEAVVGTLNVWREDENPLFLPEEALLLRRFASLAAMAYANSTQREQLRAQALTDDLTGLFNRRHFERCLSGVLRDEHGRAGPTSLVYFDLDAFKSICVVLPQTSSDQAERLARRVVGAVRAAGLRLSLLAGLWPYARRAPVIVCPAREGRRHRGRIRRDRGCGRAGAARDHRPGAPREGVRFRRHVVPQQLSRRGLRRPEPPLFLFLRPAARLDAAVFASARDFRLHA
jgi:GAF domain/Diguanylate cyclase, GGDEF domain